MHETTRSQARIFVIDDELTNLKLLDKLLRAEGYPAPVMIQDPRETKARYAEGRPDLILLDVNMPFANGYQVLAELQALGDPLLPPVVVLTAERSQAQLLRALAAGARDFIGKPFERAELLMRVRNLLDAHLAHRLLQDQKALLEEMVRQRSAALDEARLQVVRRLGRAAEYRDNETGLHVLRMSQYSTVLARSLGWDANACDRMLLASPMHDVGKIGIPDAILLKPGKLDAAEWAIMKTHSAIGAELLDDEGSDLLRLARDIALSHHEKWDGTGYPFGLAGEAIPLCGRIVAVADVFDALTSARPYKEPWSVEDAAAYIREHTGRHFDPTVAASFEANFDQILAIRASYLDPSTLASRLASTRRWARLVPAPIVFPSWACPPRLHDATRSASRARFLCLHPKLRALPSCRAQASCSRPGSIPTGCWASSGASSCRGSPIGTPSI